MVVVLPDRDVAALWPGIRAARWFQAKGRDAVPGAVTMLPPVVDRAGLRVSHAVATVVLPDRRDHYQLLLAQRAGESGWHDAVADPGALLEWADALLDREPHSPDGSWTFERFGGTPSAVCSARPFGGEQSNTTIEVDDTAMIKVFRRMDPGPNLDITTHAALNAAGVRSVARLLGAMHCDVPLSGGEQLATDLVMINERLPQTVNGWELVTAAADGYRDVARETSEIGAALALIHGVLARSFGVTALDGELVAERMCARLDRAVRLVPALADHRAGLRGLFDGLRGVTLRGQRLHGDFHLGQTLSTPAGWRIIDFEGEPLRSPAERRAPDSVWRDVAGMTRSLDYAAQSCPDPLSRAGRSWFENARTAFLSGYGLPDGAVLRAYEADKAVYETVYETLNRPGRVGIPLGAITAMCLEPAKRPDPDTAVRKDR